MTPVGIASPKGASSQPAYLEDQLADVQTVGTTSELNFEAIAALKPDLILVSKLRVDESYDQLSQIAPTVLSIRPGFPWKENFLLTADALGLENKAIEVLNEYQTHVDAVLKTFQLLNVYGIGAITCLVAFDPKDNWNHRFVPVDAQVIANQIEAATAAHDLDVVKIGMLGTPATIDTVATALEENKFKHVVLDPVLICKGQEPGAALDTDTALRAKVLPQATVVTPNNFEATTLSGLEKLETVEDLKEAARLIHEQGPQYVVVKGGMDFPGDQAVDVLFDGSSYHVFSEPKIGEERVSGAGCTFAAVITAELAKGAEVVDAVATAKRVVTRAVQDAVASNAPFASVWLAEDNK